jgi:hypothetical protein
MQKLISEISKLLSPLSGLEVFLMFLKNFEEDLKLF